MISCGCTKRAAFSGQPAPNDFSVVRNRAAVPGLERVRHRVIIDCWCGQTKVLRWPQSCGVPHLWCLVLPPSHRGDRNGQTSLLWLTVIGRGSGRRFSTKDTRVVTSA